MPAHLRQKIDWKGNSSSDVMESWCSNVDRVLFDILGNPEEVTDLPGGSGGAERYRGDWDMSILTAPEGDAPVLVESDAEIVSSSTILITKVSDDSYVAANISEGVGIQPINGYPLFVTAATTDLAGDKNSVVTKGSGIRSIRLKIPSVQTDANTVLLITDQLYPAIELFTDLLNQSLRPDTLVFVCYCTSSGYTATEVYSNLNGSLTSSSASLTGIAQGEDVYLSVDFNSGNAIISSGVNSDSLTTDISNLSSLTKFVPSFLVRWQGVSTPVPTFEQEFDAAVVDPNVAGSQPFRVLGSGVVGSLLPPVGTVDGDIFKVVNPAQYLTNIVPLSGSFVKIINNLQTILEWRITPAQTGLQAIADARIVTQCIDGGTIDLKVRDTIQSEISTSGGLIRDYVESYVATEISNIPDSPVSFVRLADESFTLGYPVNYVQLNRISAGENVINVKKTIITVSEPSPLYIRPTSFDIDAIPERTFREFKVTNSSSGDVIVNIQLTNIESAPILLQSNTVLSVGVLVTYDGSYSTSNFSVVLLGSLKFSSISAPSNIYKSLGSMSGVGYNLNLFSYGWPDLSEGTNSQKSFGISLSGSPLTIQKAIHVVSSGTTISGLNCGLAGFYAGKILPAGRAGFSFRRRTASPINELNFSLRAITPSSGRPGLSTSSSELWDGLKISANSGRIPSSVWAFGQTYPWSIDTNNSFRIKVTYDDPSSGQLTIRIFATANHNNPLTLDGVNVFYDIESTNLVLPYTENTYYSIELDFNYGIIKFIDNTTLRVLGSINYENLSKLKVGYFDDISAFTEGSSLHAMIGLNGQGTVDDFFDFSFGTLVTDPLVLTSTPTDVVNIPLPFRPAADIFSDGSIFDGDPVFFMGLDSTGTEVPTRTKVTTEKRKSIIRLSKPLKVTEEFIVTDRWVTTNEGYLSSPSVYAGNGIHSYLGDVTYRVRVASGKQGVLPPISYLEQGEEIKLTVIADVGITSFSIGAVVAPRKLIPNCTFSPVGERGLFQLSFVNVPQGTVIKLLLTARYLTRAGSNTGYYEVREAQ